MTEERKPRRQYISYQQYEKSGQLSEEREKHNAITTANRIPQVGNKVQHLSRIMESQQSKINDLHELLVDLETRLFPILTSSEENMKDQYDHAGADEINPLNQPVLVPLADQLRTIVREAEENELRVEVLAHIVNEILDRLEI